MKIDWLPVTRFEQNCSILWCEETRRAAIVDPGGDLDRILEYLDWEELTPEVILVTHGHIDHAGGAGDLSRKTGVRIEGPHRDDEHLIARLPQQGALYNVPAKCFTPARWLMDGDQIIVGNAVVDVLHCPGHTKGHVVYYSRAAKTACVGDILFRGAIGAWQHTDGNLAQLIHSIREKLFALGDDVRFVPGHGESSTFGRERRENPFVGDEALEKWKRARSGSASKNS